MNYEVTYATVREHQTQTCMCTMHAKLVTRHGCSTVMCSRPTAIALPARADARASMAYVP